MSNSVAREAAEIIRNAEAAFMRGEITRQDLADIRRRALKDANLVEIFVDGGRGIIPAELLYRPFNKTAES